VTVRRAYAAGIVLGVSLGVAVWLLTYRTTDLVQHIAYIDGQRRYYHSATRVRSQPWWAAPAGVGALLAGIAAGVALLPGSRGLVRRLAGHFAAAGPST
jgi:hypothetical protein